MPQLIHVEDDWLSPQDIKAINREWPRGDAPWVRYDSLLEKKSALPDWRHFGKVTKRTLGRLFSLPASLMVRCKAAMLALIADTTLHGAGLHAMCRGDHLDLHLDADRHPILGLERRANALLFVHERWESPWRGELEFWDEKRQLKAIEPLPGRLVVFAASETAFHGVPSPVLCPPGLERRSLAAYWWSLPGVRSKMCRPRAAFVPTPGEPDDPAKEDLRKERGQAQRKEPRDGRKRAVSP